MDLKVILSISGQSGLYKFISQARNGIIVEGIEDKKRMNAFAHYKVSSLKDISIFTDEGEVPLQKVFKTILELENGGPALEPKPDDTKLKEYFAKLLPGYDREKVYVSDIRKVIVWYNILQRNGYNDFEDEPETKETETSGEIQEAEIIEPVKE
jgi:hypothetical protein